MWEPFTESLVPAVRINQIRSYRKLQPPQFWTKCYCSFIKTWPYIKASAFAILFRKKALRCWKRIQHVLRFIVELSDGDHSSMLSSSGWRERLSRFRYAPLRSRHANPFTSERPSSCARTGRRNDQRTRLLRFRNFVRHSSNEPARAHGAFQLSVSHHQPMRKRNIFIALLSAKKNSLI